MMSLDTLSNISTTTTMTTVSSSPWTTRVIFDFTSQIILSPLVVAVNSIVLFMLYKVTSLRSRTNFLVGSLAVADLLTGLLVPLNAAHEVIQFHPIMCVASLGALTFGSTVSMQHLMLISVDRYVAVRHPTRYRELITYRRLSIAVGIVWPVHFVLAFLPLVGVRNPNWNERDCKLFAFITLWHLYLLTVISVVAPLTIMLVCYVRVFMLARERFRRIQSIAATTAALRGWRQTMTKVKITFLLCLYFLLSWTPFGVIAALGAVLGQDTVHPGIVDASLTLGFGNSFGNPILYFISQKTVRDAIVQKFCPARERSTKEKNTAVRMIMVQEANNHLIASPASGGQNAVENAGFHTNLTTSSAREGVTLSTNHSGGTSV